jgi:hypothetical protein
MQYICSNDMFGLVLIYDNDRFILDEFGKRIKRLSSKRLSIAVFKFLHGPTPYTTHLITLLAPSTKFP